MQKKRNKALTILFSLIPGGGHMFMGFMKLGVSFMSLFFLLIFFSSWLNIGPLLYALPVLWFYSFFSSINMAWADERQFSEFEDGYCFSSDNFSQVNRRLSGRGGLYFGILLLFFGIYLILSKVVQNLYSSLRVDIADTLTNIVYVFPQIFLGAVIVIIGVRLIIGKRRELNKHE